MCQVFFTKCDSYYKLRQFYYEMRLLLQNTTFITNCDSTHINRTSVIKPFKLNKLSFPSIEIKKPLLVPVHSVSQMRFKFRSQFNLLPHIRCLITLRIESSIISIVSNITVSIGRSSVHSRKSVGARMDPWEMLALTGYSVKTFDQVLLEMLYQLEKKK